MFYDQPFMRAVWRFAHCVGDDIRAAGPTVALRAEPTLLVAGPKHDQIVILKGQLGRQFCAVDIIVGPSLLVFGASSCGL